MVECSSLNYEMTTSYVITSEAQESLLKMRWRDCGSQSWWRTAKKQWLPDMIGPNSREAMTACRVSAQNEASPNSSMSGDRLPKSYH